MILNCNLSLQIAIIIVNINIIFSLESFASEMTYQQML